METRKHNTTGDSISDEVLYAEYNALYRYALSLTHNEHKAEDITQEEAMAPPADQEGKYRNADANVMARFGCQ